MDDKIIIQGASEHNLRHVDLELPRNRFIVITGVSGSGKSSLAFDTLYAEGQRRYVESLSAYARQFLGQMEKPQVDYIAGLSPAISIEQKSASHNPRSTVGTVTEVYDYLRVLFARAGTQHCPDCGDAITSQSAQQMVEQIQNLPAESRIMIAAPMVQNRKGEHRDVIDQARSEGFVRVRVDGEICDLDSPIELDKKKKHTIDIIVDRLIIRPDIRSRLTDSVETALKLSDGMLKVIVIDGEEILFSEHAACLKCGKSFPPLSPQRFSFNSPLGMCPKCSGLGTIMDTDPTIVIRDEKMTLGNGALKFLGILNDNPTGWAYRRISRLGEKVGFDLNTPWRELSPESREALLFGLPPRRMEDKSDFYQARGWIGVLNDIRRLFLQTKSEGMRRWYSQFFRHVPCPDCCGTRLNEAARAVRFHDRTITTVCSWSVSDVLNWIDSLIYTPSEQAIAGEVMKEISARLGFLRDVGLHYLTLDRSAPSLSGGEAQRIRLASQIGSGLVGVLYILDEPSIGLHARDTGRLLGTLQRLRDLGNTVIVVEHDPETMMSADFIVDMGPGAGHLGGEVVAVGSPETITAHETSLTGAYLSGRMTIPVPDRRRQIRNGFIEIKGASANNLKNIDVRIPLSRFVCVTGVSGSGKSSLVNQILFRGLSNLINRSHRRVGAHEGIIGAENIDRLIEIDQKPIGRTPRSNPATYTGVFSLIRNLFAALPEAKMRGYKPGRFSFNVKGGRCEACHGDGLKRIEMHFLADVFVPCEVCKGRRFNVETLQVRYKGLNIADVLDLEVTDAMELFRNHPAIHKILETLSDVGLDYIKLGQSATTLSGGEAQRVKLSRELAKNDTGNTLYVLDEPTTGLHFHDIRKLLSVLHRLVDMKNTIVVIEHNLDVIKNADYIIDLGPEGGDEGGYLVATGTPEEIIVNPDSLTGKFLKNCLQEKHDPKENGYSQEEHPPRKNSTHKKDMIPGKKSVANKKDDGIKNTENRRNDVGMKASPITRARSVRERMEETDNE
ncbi:excinuclease ABC subunit UvrA [bacterium]|nr:excinuclease ABC subunit UvrA [candidate division CSSED10-310 bacterium]